MVETIKMGKRGTLVLPVKMRKELGIEDGSLLTVDSTDGQIVVRPAFAMEVEIYTPQRKAEFALNNAMTKEDRDEAAEYIRGMGLDPLRIEYTDPGEREHLPARAKYSARFTRPTL